MVTTKQIIDLTWAGPFTSMLEQPRFISEQAIFGLEEANKRHIDRLRFQGTSYAMGAASYYFPIGTQIRNIIPAVSGRLSVGSLTRIYGGHILPIPTFTGMAIGSLSNYLQSIGQDGKPGFSNPPVPPRKPIGTKPSKPTRSGSTSKPFWDSGKPKCKKGFRYDFKRKLCVKIK